MVQTVVFNDLQHFNDLGCEGKSCDIGSRRANKTVAKSMTNDKQQYSLYPNPNNGNITIMQDIADSKPVMAEVLNSVGESIFKENLNFATRTTNIKVINALPGFYLMHLIDSKGRVFTIKFNIK